MNVTDTGTDMENTRGFRIKGALVSLFSIGVLLVLVGVQSAEIDGLRRFYDDGAILGRHRCTAEAGSTEFALDGQFVVTTAIIDDGPKVAQVRDPCAGECPTVFATFNATGGFDCVERPFTGVTNYSAFTRPEITMSRHDGVALGWMVFALLLALGSLSFIVYMTVYRMSSGSRPLSASASV